MQHLNTLWQAVSAVSELKEMTRQRQTYYFSTIGPITFYLRAENATVQVMRWALPKIEVAVTLNGVFGWRIATDQDDAGVYVVARKRSVIGGFSSADFQVIVPHDALLMLNLIDGRVTLDHVSGTLEIPPTQAENLIQLLPSGD